MRSLESGDGTAKIWSAMKTVFVQECRSDIQLELGLSGRAPKKLAMAKNNKKKKNQADNQSESKAIAGIKGAAIESVARAGTYCPSKKAWLEIVRLSSTTRKKVGILRELIK